MAFAAPEEEDSLGGVGAVGELDDLSEGLSQRGDSQLEGAQLLGSVEEGEQRVHRDTAGNLSRLGAEFQLLGCRAVESEFAVDSEQGGVFLSRGAVAHKVSLDVADALLGQILLELSGQCWQEVLEDLLVLGRLLDQDDDVGLAVRALHHTRLTNGNLLVAQRASSYKKHITENF